MKLKFRWSKLFSNSSKASLLLLLVSTLMATSDFHLLPFQESKALVRAKNFQPVEVLILENPLTSLKDRTGSNWGLDEERLQSFSRYTGLQLKVFVFKKQADLSAAYDSGRGQIIISRQQLDLKNVTPGPFFEEVRQGIFCRRESRAKKTFNLSEQRIIKASWPMQTKIKDIQNRKADCLVSEIKEGLFATQPYFNLMKVGEIPTDLNYAWSIRHRHHDLRNLLLSWHRKIARSGEFANINRRFEMSLQSLSPYQIRSFQQNIKTLLPEYQSAFKDVATEVKLPWTLIAAVAYQESGWNHDAVSFTGVKGLMQLTLDTASHMGISDREDPFQSIWGGARYLRHLWEAWPQIRNPRDRMKVTLASYNAGIAHIFDVIEILKQRNQDPYLWKNIESVLPLLQDPTFCEELPYGCSRGNETVDFVRRSYSYYQLLSIAR